MRQLCQAGHTGRLLAAVEGVQVQCQQVRRGTRCRQASQALLMHTSKHAHAAALELHQL